MLQSRTNKVHACLSELLEWSDNVMLRREDACVEGAQKILSSLQESLQALVDYYDKDNLTRKRPNTANGLSHSKSEWYVIHGLSCVMLGLKRILSSPKSGDPEAVFHCPNLCQIPLRRQ